MSKIILIGRPELEALLLATLRATRGCEGASSVVIYRIAPGQTDSNWTVASFNPGTSGMEACRTALTDSSGSCACFTD